MLATDPSSQTNAQLVPSAETPDARIPVIRNLNPTTGPPIPKPRSPSTWSSRSSSEWEVLSEGSTPRSVTKVIADFDEKDQEWYPGAVRVPAGTQVQFINKKYDDSTYSQVQINNKNMFIPKRLLKKSFVTQPFVTSTFCPSSMSSINHDNSPSGSDSRFPV